MANPSHIAMLAQIRSDLFDRICAVGEVTAELSRARDFRNVDARQVEDQLHTDVHALARLMLSQRPTDLHDAASITHAIADAADDLQTLAEPEEGKPVNTVQIARLAMLVERAADNVVALLATSAPPRNDVEKRRVRIIMQTAALTPLNQPEGE